MRHILLPRLNNNKIRWAPTAVVSGRPSTNFSTQTQLKRARAHKETHVVHRNILFSRQRRLRPLWNALTRSSVVSDN